MTRFVQSFAALIVLSSCLWAQEPTDSLGSESASPFTETPAAAAEALNSSGNLEAEEPASRTGDLTQKARELADEAQGKAEEIAKKVDQDERAKKAAEGLLGRIYMLAESLNFDSFHWLAFGLMAAGVVSFALQLVLGKLFLLFRGSLNIREICSDAVGLVISVVGLVLTTQAAAENSEFTHSPAAVLSAAGFGIVAGFMLYRWGHAQEVHAVKGQRSKGA